MLKELTCHTWAVMFWIVSLIFSPIHSSSLSTNSNCTYLHAHIPIRSDLALWKMTINADTTIVLVQSPSCYCLLSNHFIFVLSSPFGRQEPLCVWNIVHRIVLIKTKLAIMSNVWKEKVQESFQQEYKNISQTMNHSQNNHTKRILPYIISGVAAASSSTRLSCSSLWILSASSSMLSKDFSISQVKT